MNNILKLSDKERKELFELTAEKKGVIEALVEKDFWVCFVLEKIFKDEELQNIFLFKGGTSLSKCFNLIERFSEDIDLILDWRELGITDEVAWKERSGTQQDKFNKEVDEISRSYISEKVLPHLTSLLRPANIKIDPDDGNVVIVEYPASFSNPYLLNYIKLEIGPRASRIPRQEVSISSYAGEEYPALFNNPVFTVKTITPERTFWEKATILHQVAYISESKPIPPRYSRHYYDLFKMATSQVKHNALKDLELLKQVRDFKIKFYRSPPAKYDLAVPGTFKILPSIEKILKIEEDYHKMKEMFFVKPPEFKLLLKILKELENEINSLQQLN